MDEKSQTTQDRLLHTLDAIYGARRTSIERRKQDEETALAAVTKEALVPLFEEKASLEASIAKDLDRLARMPHYQIAKRISVRKSITAQKSRIKELNNSIDAPSSPKMAEKQGALRTIYAEMAAIDKAYQKQVSQIDVACRVYSELASAMKDGGKDVLPALSQDTLGFYQSCEALLSFPPQDLSISILALQVLRKTPDITASQIRISTPRLCFLSLDRIVPILNRMDQKGLVCRYVERGKILWRLPEPI